MGFVLQSFFCLATAPREGSAYLGQVNELTPFVLEASVDMMKARGQPRLILSDMERGILATLSQMLPASGSSYEQVLRDLTQGSRVSWRGTAAELREVLREVIDTLAPDDKVMQQTGFQLEAGRTGPTQRQ